MKIYPKIVTVFFLAIFTTLAHANQNTLNIYIWGNYLPYEIANQFTKETGIKVNIIEYDNNETMYAKLKSLNNSGYDIIVPSSYYVERMSKQGMLLNLDKKKLTNLHHLNPLLLNKEFDLKNNYSIPYIWGTTGIIINTKYIDKKNVTSWQDFWNKRYKNQLMLLNDMRDVFSMSLLSLGYPINDSNEKHIEEAYFKLKQLLPNVKIFSVDTVPNIYIDEDAYIGMAWSGDCKLAQDENTNLEYIYPKEGFAIWIDSFVIIKDAPHADNAHKFINFMLRPEIAKQISVALGYSTANKDAVKLMPLASQRNPILNPSKNIMRQGRIQLDLDNKTKRLYEKYWEKLKINN
ncbi:MAG: spermidine/putrescine ABC transporter substrate-binding protein [Gammaproteobacteria bacterium]|nr:spermidine/putrescine ABC transporter substrate-binding protein [Gammaproteobacteria bacterium]